MGIVPVLPGVGVTGNIASWSSCSLIFRGFILALKGVWVGWDDWVWLVVGWVVE